MSRIGKKPIKVPQGVSVEISENICVVKGPKGTLKKTFDPDMIIELDGDVLSVKRPTDNKRHKALHGLTRQLLYNMIEGVSKGFKKELQIVGVGYSAQLQGKALRLNLGYSHPIIFIPPDEIKLEVPEQTKIVVSGIDKQLVGQIAAKIRSFRKPEPYKGKGIRYVDEYVRRKAGKTVGAK